jgi:hypothetical protein
VPCHVFVFPIAPETGHAPENETLVEREQNFGPDAEFLEHTRSEGIDYYVDMRDKRLYEGYSGGRFQVYGDGGFITGK